jgi:predicted alpha-1,2-mannosidase
MNHFRFFAFFVLLSVLTGCTNADPLASKDGVRGDGAPTDFVDPFIGTGGHGHTYPGATMPFGLVQLSPDTRLEGWDGCGGYHYSDDVIYGFSHTHLQGTGVSDYGDILFMPTNNETKTADNWHDRYSSSFSKKSEVAEAGYYKVDLDDHDMKVELTATTRVGIHRYTPKNASDTLTLFIDMEHRDDIIEYSLYPQGDTIILGHRISRNWAEEQHVYFVAWFSEPFDFRDQTFELTTSVDSVTGMKTEEMEYVPVFPLVFDPTKELIAKVGISAVSVDGAWNNMVGEALHWDFDQYRNDAKATWNEALSKIEVDGANKEDVTNFYTALYHSMTVPNTFNDVDGNYRGTDMKIHRAEGRDHYTIFSLWDTFRATHPLYTIIEQKRTGDFVQTFLDMYRQGGQLPIWELSANYTGCMIGYHSVPVIHDAFVKGITNFDHELALEAMIQIADSAHLGKPEFAEYGFIPAELEAESVSKGLEYAYNDWNIADYAKRLGDNATYDRFIERAQYYKNIYNPQNGFMQAKRNGTWLEPFDPYEVNFCFTEANSFQYSFFAPQDVNGMIKMIGGDEAFCKDLDRLFTAESSTTGREQADITGLIGQYAHGNEPSHHMAYLYDYAGQPWKTQKYVRQILTEQYTAAPDGLSGNEDCGQMSSWYVLSSMGFYPVTPGSTQYALGSPLFDKATINLENGKQFSITATNNSPSNVYIESISLNGAPYELGYLEHSTIMAGGEMNFVMTSTPNETRAIAADQRPLQAITDHLICPVPYYELKRTFSEPYNLAIRCNEPEVSIHYAIDYGDSQETGIYEGPIEITESCSITAWSEKNGLIPSRKIYGETLLIDGSREIVVESEFANQYAAGGERTLIDFLRGSNEFKTGEWQGYWGQDLVAIVDLGEVKAIKHTALGALQDTKPWIIYPKQVEFFVSTDGKNFTSFGTAVNDVDAKDYTIQHRDFEVFGSTKARYVKVVATNYGILPDWHLGAGGKAWLFVDEIVID